MCLLVVAWKTHPRYRLVVAANRDEFHDRPSAPLGWWQDDDRILAGRDLRGGGTWMGVHRSGRCAFVTNFREVESPVREGAPSRGELAHRYLASRETPAEYAAGLGARAEGYAGFNLLLGDRDSLYYAGNRAGAAPREIPPGIHGLSNHLLDSPWPKLLRTKARFAAVLAAEEPEPEALFAMLADRRPAEDDEIPDTGLPPDWERALSAPFVAHERYGTRCSTLLTLRSDGLVTMIERRYDAPGGQTGATRRSFRCETP